MAGFGSGAIGFQGLCVRGGFGVDAEIPDVEVHASAAVSFLHFPSFQPAHILPGQDLSVGVSLSQPPLTRVMVVLMTCCSWLILPVTWRLTSPTIRLPPFTSMWTMRKRSKGTAGPSGC